MRFPVRLCFTYGSLGWTGAVLQSELVDLNEPVRTRIIQSFIYREVYYFAEQERSDFWCGLEVNPFLSYDRLLKGIICHEKKMWKKFYYFSNIFYVRDFFVFRGF